MNKSLKSLEDSLGHTFKDITLLKMALTHASRTASINSDTTSNERLEFLGDRVLGLVIAELLYERFPDEEEGPMSHRFTALVRSEALSRVAENIDIGSHLDVARSEEETGGRKNPAILADACEALIAALYLDAGLDAAKKFIRNHWEELLSEDHTPPKDAKTSLQEWSQARNLGLPIYSVTSSTGPSHSPNFMISVAVKNLPDQSAEGTSKRKAEQAAAGAMMAYIETTET